jgi:fluoride exporter
MSWRMLSVAVGGALGAITRYELLQLLGGAGEGVLPWGTFAANILGSLLLGVVAGLIERRAFSEGVRLFLIVGLLGGFTTFSFFSYENLELLRDDRYLALSINVIGQIIVGLGAAIAGYKVAYMVGVENVRGR